jgi:predicted transcriptional regulator
MEIMNELLSLSVDGVKKTKLLYNCNLSHSQLNRYLSFLMENDVLRELVVNDNGNFFKLYKPTDKGLELLDDLKKVLSYFEDKE